jgi:hypothetical protein
MDPEECSACQCPGRWDETDSFVLLAWVRPSNRYLCPECAQQELDAGTIQLNMDSPDWLYVVYPANAAADMWCTKTERFATRSWTAFKRYMDQCANQHHRLCVGIERNVHEYQGAYRNCIIQAIAHGGPISNVMNDEFITHVYDTYNGVFRVYRIRDAQCANFHPHQYASLELFTEAIHAHVKGGEWFGCTPINHCQCDVPNEKWWPLYLHPRECITWIDSYDKLCHSIRFNPEWRLSLEEVQYIDV